MWWTWWDSTRAPAGAWSLAVTTVHRTVALYRSSFESHSQKRKAIAAVAAMTFLGGPGGIRTHDLSDANRTLSQLSYRPKCKKIIYLFERNVNNK